VFLPAVTYAGISKREGSKLEKFGQPEAGGLRAEPPAVGGYGVWGQSPHCWRKFAILRSKSSRFYEFLVQFHSEVSAELYGINGLPPKLCSIICVHKINSVLKIILTSHTQTVVELEYRMWMSESRESSMSDNVMQCEWQCV